MYSLATVYSLFGISNMSALNFVFVMAKICPYYAEISPTMGIMLNAFQHLWLLL